MGGDQAARIESCCTNPDGLDAHFGDRHRRDSDVDLLAAFDRTRRISLLDVAGIEIQLPELLGQPVDLIEEGTLKQGVRRTVEAEAVRAF